MRTVDTPDRSAPTAVRVVELTRRQLLVVALLACVPLPLVSIATTAVPLPDIVQRAAASLFAVSRDERETPNARTSVAPRMRGARRPRAHEFAARADDISPASRPSATRPHIRKTRVSSMRNDPDRASPSGAVASTGSGVDTTAGTTAASKPTPPEASQPAVQDLLPSAGASDGKKTKSDGGGKVSGGATTRKNQSGTGGKDSESKAADGDSASGQKTGQDGTHGNSGDKSKP